MTEINEIWEFIIVLVSSLILGFWIIYLVLDKYYSNIENEFGFLYNKYNKFNILETYNNGNKFYVINYLKFKILWLIPVWDYISINYYCNEYDHGIKKRKFDSIDEAVKFMNDKFKNYKKFIGYSKVVYSNKKDLN